MNPLSMTACAALLATAQAATGAPPDPQAARHEVAATERAFARSMAERDPAAFERHLSEQAVFFSPGRVLHGRAEVAAGWRHHFDAKDAPFSWEPDSVEVTSDGLLAYSTGPVRDPAGVPIARFHSVWRLEAPHTWRIVFDRGEPWREPNKP